jgi:hypothetical protein
LVRRIRFSYLIYEVNVVFNWIVIVFLCNLYYNNDYYYYEEPREEKPKLQCTVENYAGSIEEWNNKVLDAWYYKYKKS